MFIVKRSRIKLFVIIIIIENDVLFQKVTQAYSEKNPTAPIRIRPSE